MRESDCCFSRFRWKMRVSLCQDEVFGRPWLEPIFILSLFSRWWNKRASERARIYVKKSNKCCQVGEEIAASFSREKSNLRWHKQLNQIFSLFTSCYSGKFWLGLSCSVFPLKMDGKKSCPQKYILLFPVAFLTWERTLLLPRLSSAIIREGGGWRMFRRRKVCNFKMLPRSLLPPKKDCDLKGPPGFFSGNIFRTIFSPAWRARHPDK